MMRFGFVTCVELGLGCIEEIYRIGGNLELLITLTDDQARRKAGRVWLDSIAARHSVPLVKVRHINDPPALRAVREHRIDWLFIIGWSQIAGKAVLDSVRRGVVGMHPTLLPTGRGRAPIPWAILLELPSTGVTMFQLDEGVDTGPIIDQEVLPLSPDETATTLYARVEDAHRRLIARKWNDLAEGRIRLVEQDEGRATVWPARRPEDGALSTDMCVAEFDRLVRATTRPYPGAFLRTRTNVIRIWSGIPLRTPEEIVEGKSAVPWGTGLAVRCSDGTYLAEEYDVEPEFHSDASGN